MRRNISESIMQTLTEDSEVIETGKWGEDTIQLRQTSGTYPYDIVIGWKDDLSYVKDHLFFKDLKAAKKEFDRLKALKVKEFTYEDKKAFAESINMQPLFDKINKFVGAKLTFKTEIEDDKYNSSVRILFESDDMKEYCGVFGKILRSCVVDNFSCGVGENEDRTGLRAWWSVHLSYQHKDGGMNGMELFRAHYENGKWTFNEK